MKIRRCEERNEFNTNMQAHTFCCLLACQPATWTTIILVHTHSHTVYIPSIISPFDALAFRLIGTLEGVTAYNITMMEMSLYSSVLWVTCVLVAKIESQALISYIQKHVYTVTTPVDAHTYIPHTLHLYVVLKYMTTDLHMEKLPTPPTNLLHSLTFTICVHFCPSLVPVSVNAQCYLWMGHWLLYLIKILYSKTYMSSSTLQP